jgi:serine/threonine protein kinase
MQSGQKVRDYVFEEKIGEGGMGEVWRARHSVLQRQVAVKVMARELASDPQFEERFLREARAQAGLHHPRILAVTEFFSENGVYYLVMPLVNGETLTHRLERAPGPLPPAQALAIARDILDALDYAHQRGVIHRDVKPSNVMLDREGHAFLLDFGIALPLGQRRLTRTGTTMGSSYYISPEQVRNPREVDHRTDVYSAGCVLYEMLAGRPPFLPDSPQGDTDFALKEAHMYQTPRPIASWNPAVPPSLDALVLRALEKNPDRRFGGCGEFRRSLDSVERSGGGALPPPRPALPALPAPTSQAPPQPFISPPPVLQQAAPPKSGSSALGRVVVAGLVGLLIVLGYLGSHKQQEESPEAPAATTSAPAAAPQSDGGSAQVHTALDDVTQKIAATYDKSSDYFNELPPSHRADVNADLIEGRNYLLTAVCDSHCSDIDLALLDRDGSVLVQDVQEDDSPVLEIRAPRSGKFTLRIGMAKCSTSSCHYAIGLYRKRT